MKLKKNFFLIRKIKNNEYIIYNSKKHIPIKIDDIGKEYFDIILKHQTKNECLKNISINNHTEFTNFYNTLKKVDFLSNIEEHYDKGSMFSKFELANKLFYLHLTDRCNLKCSYCYNKEQRVNIKDLDFNTWKTIIDKISPYAANVVLTGGEVFLHKDIKEIINYIKSKNIKVIMISNGCIDYEKAKLENTLQIIDRIFLSCDNLKDNKHERKGFNKDVFLKNINYIEKLNLKNKISIGAVWTNNGTDGIKHLDDFCKERSIAFHRTVCIPFSQEATKMMCSVKEHYNYLKFDNTAKTTSDNIDITIGSDK